MTVANALKSCFRIPYGCYKLVASQSSELRKSGWFESVGASQPIAKDGSVVPWMNYAIVDLFKERLNDGLSMFEYGSGFSTCFFAARVKSIKSVEYDEQWHEKVVQMVPSNASVVFEPYDESPTYREAILRDEDSYDVIVIDGQDRVGCIRVASDRLSQQGVIVLDDSDRDYYQRGFDHMNQRGYRSLSIAGMKPGSASRHQTTIFYRDGNCLAI